MEDTAKSSFPGGKERQPSSAPGPDWRAVLKRIAIRLDQEGVAYAVVGGASVALQGLSIAVKDIDLEMDKDSAYRFQTLFLEQVVKPVSLGETDHYRSHFGRFDFDGMLVEVMGELQRRDGDNWVPSATLNHRIVDLEGEPVKVSWLEEETLAYIRRGRMDRAAACLALCDQGRLLRLLKGERKVGVL